MSPFSGTKLMDDWVGNTSIYAYLPEILSYYGQRMNILQRTLNFYFGNTYEAEKNIVCHNTTRRHFKEII
jgi:uncharacterized circularly permuted ATP-grasp superfamily protein